MKREELRKAYAPTAALEMRVGGVLGAIREENEVKKAKGKRIAVLAVCMALMVTAAAGAAGLLFSDGYDVTRRANRALAEEYGITEEMQTFFASEVREENGVTTVIYSGMTGLRHVLGEYTVVIRDGETAVSWSKDGESTEGELDAHAWGAKQISILMDMAKQENGISRGYRKAQEIRMQMDGEDMTVSITKGGNATVVALTDAQSEQVRISVSEEDAIAIAKRAFEQEYGLTKAQLDAMIYEKDYAGYTYAVIDGKTICEVWFWLHQDEDVVHTAGDGLYWARINAETGVVEEMMYDSALAGNG